MRQLDIPGTAELITTFVKRTVTEAGFSRLAAVSGDVDSATPVALAAAAVAVRNGRGVALADVAAIRAG
ncbi:MAG TPA: hypothetical protein VJ022_01365 [Anaerolineales bacterium]|nr:hypothetical protein [Anaerolineales bacterium]